MLRLFELAKKYKELDEQEKKAKEQKEEIKKEIAEIAENSGGFVGGKSYKNSFLTVTMTFGTIVETADVDKMKTAGIWDDYKKASERKGSIKVSVKEKGLQEFEKTVGDFEQSPMPDITPERCCIDDDNDDDLGF